MLTPCSNRTISNRWSWIRHRCSRSIWWDLSLNNQCTNIMRLVNLNNFSLCLSISTRIVLLKLDLVQNLNFKLISKCQLTLWWLKLTSKTKPFHMETVLKVRFIKIKKVVNRWSRKWTQSLHFLARIARYRRSQETLPNKRQRIIS